MGELPAPSRAAEGVRETGRLEAFSDGVFAIAITLLILEIRVPHLGEDAAAGELLGALGRLWPAYLAYATSFATILIMWINHHRNFRCVRRVSHPLFILNGLLLLCITFVPFPTALLTEYLQRPAQAVAAAVYSGTFVVTAVIFNLLWHHVARSPRLLDPRVNPQFLRRTTRGYAVAPLVYLVAFGLGFLSAALSLAVCLALAVFFALPSPVSEIIDD
jgi:uncharacterized membrane protein